MATPADGPYLAAIVKLIGKEIPEVALARIDAAAIEPAKRRRRGQSRRSEAPQKAGAPREAGAHQAERSGAPGPAKRKRRGRENADSQGAWGGDSPVPAFLTRPLRDMRDKGD